MHGNVQSFILAHWVCGVLAHRCGLVLFKVQSVIMGRKNNGETSRATLNVSPVCLTAIAEQHDS